jgi:hypothetical protein
MSRDELRLILGIAVAMAKNSMTGGQETLPYPLNPSRKFAQPSDSNCYTQINPLPIPGNKMTDMMRMQSFHYRRRFWKTKSSPIYRQINTKIFSSYLI